MKVRDPNLLKNSPRRLLYAKILSILLILSVWLTWVAFIKDNTNSQSAMNWDLASVLVVGVLSTTLTILHSGIYQVYWLKNNKHLDATADERQLAVRRRVFEKSYKILSLIIIVGVFIVASASNNFFPLKNRNAVQVPFVQLLLYLILLPSVVASWEKDA